MGKFFLISGTLCGYLIFTRDCHITQMNVHLCLTEGESTCVKINKKFSNPLTFCDFLLKCSLLLFIFPKSRKILQSLIRESQDMLSMRVCPLPWEICALQLFIRFCLPDSFSCSRELL